MHQLFTLLPLLAPICFLLYAMRTLLINRHHGVSPLATQIAGVFGMLVAIISAGYVALQGSNSSTVLSWAELGFGIRLDSLSVTMFTMISVLAFVILRFSTNYLEGDPRKPVFMARLATTIASVQLLVLSGNLMQLLVFWVLTSVCLHYLLVFYRHRPQAIAAARKKFIVARIGDVSLFLAFALIYFQMGTGDLGKIFSQLQATGSLDSTLTMATVLLAVAALLKSAQFPTHGWLIEVVETPTPVSALLHAGLLNAGPFLIVRMSLLISASAPASLMLIIIGGFTALFASVVYMTQPSIKVSLGYSSVAHMGFSLLACGFGVYAAAILHLVGHSFYKAHSFLSSGSIIDLVRARKVAAPARRGNHWLILLSVAISVAIYALVASAWGKQPGQEFGLIAIGAIIAIGISQIVVQTLDSFGTAVSVLQSATLALLVAVSFFAMEAGAHTILQSQIPEHYAMGAVVQSASWTILTAFMAVIGIQLLAPTFPSSEFGRALGIHLRNGLYANVVFDRMVGSLKNDKFKWANLTIHEDDVSESTDAQIAGQSELINK